MISNVVWSAISAVLLMFASVVCAVREFPLSVVLALALAGVTCAVLSIRE